MVNFRVFAGSLVLMAGLAVPSLAADPDAATVVARVNGTEITLGHMIALREQLPEQYLQLPDEVLFNGILDQLIQQLTVAQSAEDALSLRDRLVLDNNRRGYLTGALLDRAVEAGVTDTALQSLYDETYGTATPGTEYHAAHILLATKEEAAAVKAELDAGADFATLAQDRSTGPSGPNGGDLGWFGPGMMVQPFEDAVIALQAGEVSDPVETQFGWHVIRLNETRAAAAPTLDDTRQSLTEELQQRLITARLAELAAAAEIERTDEAIDPAILKNSALIDN